MASPLTKKYKWPSDKQATTDVAGMAADFVPYVTNLVNTFRKVPRPKAPKLIDPISGARISLADAKKDVEETTRAADLNTQNLDAQSGAAVRVANLGNRFRALGDLASREAYINAQLGQQTKATNASIDAQNTAITNQYRDDQVNAEMAQQRVQSENLANAADKFITQQAVRDQIALDKQKAQIASKAYNPGVYGRLATSLQDDGVTIPGTAPIAPQPSSFQTSINAMKNTKLKPFENTDPDFKLDNRTIAAMRKKLSQGRVFAAGGMMRVRGEDPKPKNSPVKLYGKSPMAITGTNAFDKSSFAMETDDRRMADGIDMVNSIIGTGVLPDQTEQNQVIRNTLDPEMYQYLYMFNQRSDLQGMTPEQRVQTFYNIPSNNPNIQAMKNNMKRYGHGPLSFYRGSTSEITPKSVAKRSYGGRLKPFA